MVHLNYGATHTDAIDGPQLRGRNSVKTDRTSKKIAKILIWGQAFVLKGVAERVSVHRNQCRCASVLS